MENTQSPNSQTTDIKEENQAEGTPTVEESLRASLESEKNKYLYLYAEFENYKKRAIKERSELIKYGNESMLRELLGITDNLHRAVAHSTQTEDPIIMGVKMVLEQFKDTLSRFGVTEIITLGQKFDPEKHEAVAQESSDQESGTILKEHLKGYLLHGRLLRAAKVVISSGNSASG